MLSRDNINLILCSILILRCAKSADVVKQILDNFIIIKFKMFKYDWKGESLYFFPQISNNDWRMNYH